MNTKTTSPTIYLHWTAKSPTQRDRDRCHDAAFKAVVNLPEPLNSDEYTEAVDLAEDAARSIINGSPEIEEGLAIEIEWPGLSLEYLCGGSAMIPSTTEGREWLDKARNILEDDDADASAWDDHSLALDDAGGFWL